MKWTVKLIAEPQPGKLVEGEVITLKRDHLIAPATVGLTIAEGQAIMESLNFARIHRIRSERDHRAKRVAKKQQMRWNRYTVQQFLYVRVSRSQSRAGRCIELLAPRLRARLNSVSINGSSLTPRNFACAP